MPAGAAPRTETVTGQFNVTLPNGNSLLGTVVADRTSGTPITTVWHFQGMINGIASQAAGTATELWRGPGVETIQITSISTWQMPLAQPALLPIQVVEINPSLVTLNGIPMAISPPIQAPFSGGLTYIVTNPAQGTRPISAIPNTSGDGPGPGDWLPVLGLLGGGLLLGIAGLMWPAMRRR